MCVCLGGGCSLSTSTLVEIEAICLLLVAFRLTSYGWRGFCFFAVERLIRTVSQNCSAKKTPARRRQGKITEYALLQSSGLCLCACVKQIDAVWHRDRRSDRKRLCLWVTLLPASVYTWLSMPIFVSLNFLTWIKNIASGSSKMKSGWAPFLRAQLSCRGTLFCTDWCTTPLLPEGKPAACAQ